MNGKHWTDDELLEALYGVRRAGDHLRDCAECKQRWEAFAEPGRRWSRNWSRAQSRMPHCWCASALP